VKTIDDMSPEMSTVSLVTGGHRGVGREVCRHLAEPLSW